jgi:hypothetical protein
MLTSQDIKEAKRIQAANELRNKVMSVSPGQAVKIKSSRGSFEVKMVQIFEEEQKAQVQHEAGQLTMVKWTEFDFRPTAAHKPVENEYGPHLVRSLGLKLTV